MPVEVIGSIGPRPYQQEGIEFLRTRKRAAIWDEMGLGKTSQALYAIPPGSQTLVLTVKSALGVWENEAAKWLGLDVMTYVGPPKQRESTWQSYCAAGSILVAPYSMTSELVRRRAVWDVIVLDEAHKLKSRNSQTSIAMRAFKSEYMFQLTGSPAPHDPGDYWAQLHLLDPKTFPSYWAFVNKYMHLVELDYKPEIKVIEGIRDRAGLKELLSRFALRRTKRSVGIQLPAKIRQTIPCRLNKRQQVTYNDMERDFVTKLAEDHWVLSPNAMVTALRLRQLAISPAVLGGEDNSGVLDAVMEQLILDLEAGNKVVIFSCFRKPLDLIAGRIQAKKLGLDCIFMVGGLKTDEVSARLKRFDTGASQLLLASVSIAQGWAATSANTAYFVGPDYSAEVNYQAEDRLHRIGQTRTVVIKYFMTPEDERLQDILNNKVRLRNLTEIVTTALATSDEFGS